MQVTLDILHPAIKAIPEIIYSSNSKKNIHRNVLTGIFCIRNKDNFTAPEVNKLFKGNRNTLDFYRNHIRFMKKQGWVTQVATQNGEPVFTFVKDIDHWNYTSPELSVTE